MSEETTPESSSGSESQNTEKPLLPRTGSALSAIYYAALKARKIDFERAKLIPFEERVRIANERMNHQRTKLPLPEIQPPHQP